MSAEAAGAPKKVQATPGTFEAGKGTFLLNGEPFVVKAAEVHYPRIPRPYWEHRIQMCKALGMNTLCLYVFWNIHEQQEGVFDYPVGSEERDVHHLASWPLRLCRMGNGRSPMVAAQEEGHPSA